MSASAQTASPATLLLFDIDGTLLQRAASAHAAALHTALAEVFDIRDARRHEIEAAGRTDVEIARDLLGRSGITTATIDAHADALARAWMRAYSKSCEPDLSHTVAPGIPALLGQLAARADVHLALLTGNLEPIARLKLDRAGIGHHFVVGQGAFGSDSEDRTQLPAIARARAGGEQGAPWPRERTVLIGDTPRDIACARADGVRVLAVATGGYTVEQLADADGVAADASALWPLLDAALGGARSVIPDSSSIMS